MKRGILLALMITGLVGFVYWQFDVAHQDGAGEIRAIAVTQQITDAKIETASKSIDQDGKIVLEEKLNSDAAFIADDNSVDTTTEKYVASGSPEKIMDYYATLRQARAELVLSKFSAEQHDPNWTSEMMDRFKVATKMIPGLPDFNISKSDCRETICAIQLDMNKSNYKQYAPYIKHIGTVLGQDTWVHHDAKPGIAIIYLSRVEQSLPTLKSEATIQE